jgi:uroporphyrinogen III methyltransferase/synthase
LITRAGEQSAAFARALLGRGAEPILAPTILIRFAQETRAADEAIERLASYAWLVFTSQNGVDAFCARLAARNADARRIGATQVAAIGDRTAERLRRFGVIPDLVPERFVAEHLAAEIVARSSAGEHVLLYRAQEARDVLPQMLEAAGLHVTIVSAYGTAIPADASFAQKVARADAITFTSASTVRGFVALLGEGISPAQAAGGKCIACIGPITAGAATQAGLHVDVVADVSTTADLLDSLERYYAEQQ